MILITSEVKYWQNCLSESELSMYLFLDTPHDAVWQALLEGSSQELPTKAQTEALLLITADQQLANDPGPIRWLAPRL